MSSLVKRYKAWRSGREQRSLEHWAQERVKGRKHYVLRSAFFFVVLMTAFNDVYDHLFGAGVHAIGLGFYLVRYAVTGLIIGYFVWGSEEGKYKNAQLNRRLQTPFDDRILPR